MDDSTQIREVPMLSHELGDKIEEGGWQKTVAPPKASARPPGMVPAPGKTNGETKKENEQ